MALAKTPGLELPIALRHAGTRALAASLAPTAGRKSRFVPGSAKTGPQRRASGAPPRALGAGARGLGQRTGKAVYAGREGSSSARRGPAADYSPRGCAWRGARSSKPPPGRTPTARPPGGARKALSTRRHRLPPRPLGDACGRLRVRQSFFLHGGRPGLPGSPGRNAQSPRRQAYRGAGARDMVGRPTSAAARETDSAGTCVPGWNAGTECWGPQPHPRRAVGARGARGRAGGGGGCSGPRPAATIPPAALAAKSWGCRRPDRRPGRGGCRRSGRPRRAALCSGRAGSQLPPRLGLRDAPRAESAPRARTLCTSPPPLPFLPPARQAPLSSPLSPPLLSPFPGPRPAATRSVYGGAERAPSRASSAPRGDPPGPRGRGRPGRSPFRRAWGGGSKSLDRIWLGSHSSWALREGGGALLTQPAKITSGG